MTRREGRNVHRLGRAVAVVLVLASSAYAHAVDRFSAAFGSAGEVKSAQVEAGWTWPRSSLPAWLAWTRGEPRLDLAAIAWRSDAADAARVDLYGLGVRPALRWPLGERRSMFLEFGVGPRIWSGTRVGSSNRFGTAFEFGTALTLGWNVGHFELFTRIEHTSNAGLRAPNPGIDFLQLGVAWHP